MARSAVGRVDERVARLKALAVQRGLRMTPQRAVLLSVLGRMTHHPTSDELYRRVRKALPSVSPATVYRNLQVLVQANVISMLERSGGAFRYDPNPDEHHHFICRRCARVVDVYLSAVGYRMDARGAGLRGARIESCEVQLRGICPPCRSRA